MIDFIERNAPNPKTVAIGLMFVLVVSLLFAIVYQPDPNIKMDEYQQAYELCLERDLSEDVCIGYAQEVIR